MSVQGIGNQIVLPSALESGREGINRATEMMANSAQDVAGVIVELSSDESSKGVKGASLTDGILDAQVAEYMALANVRVITVVDSLSDEVMTLVGNND
jgi:hypothetical protein